MNAGIYINFRKESKDAIAFYETIFNTKCNDIMTFGDMPPSEHFPITDEMKPLILNASLDIHELKVMFSDVPEGMELTIGNNISIVINITDADLLTKQFNQLAEDGTIVMPLDKTFWSEKYGYVIDKFGIGWQFSLA